MAAQIIYAKESGKLLEFGNFDDTVNLTDFLDETVGDLFVEKKYYEDEDELSYRVVDYKNITNLVKKVKESEDKKIDELKDARGNEKKMELIEQIRDLSLVYQTVIKALLQDCKNEAKVIALI